MKKTVNKSSVLKECIVFNEGRTKPRDAVRYLNKSIFKMLSLMTMHGPISSCAEKLQCLMETASIPTDLFQYQLFFIYTLKCTFS